MNLPGLAGPQLGAKPQKPQKLAPFWHTATLIAVIVTVAVTGTLLTRQGISVQVPAVPMSRSAVYLQMLLVAWGLLFYVCRLGRSRNELPALIGQTWPGLSRASIDLILAALAWLFIKLCEWAWGLLLPAASNAAVAALLPHTGLERALWVLVALSVGFSEEVIYRGYLQTQLTAFTGRAGVALVLQAALFGLAHAEQGPGAMLRLAVYGLVFGAVARWRGSLLPTIVCHVWTDLVSGLGA